MAYKSAEQVLENLQTVLQDNFADALTQVESEHTATLNLPVPANSNYFIANSIDTTPEVSNMPALTLMCWNESATFEGEQAWDQWDLDCAVRLWNSGYDQVNLTKSVYRYTEAIFRIVRTTFLALSGIENVHTIRKDYSSVSPTDPLFQASEVSFSVRLWRGDYSF